MFATVMGRGKGRWGALLIGRRTLCSWGGGGERGEEKGAKGQILLFSGSWSDTSTVQLELKN